MRKIILAAFAVTGIFACVPIKEYKDQQNAVADCQQQRDSLRNALETTSVKLTELEGKHSKLEDVAAKLVRDTTSLGKRNRDQAAYAKKIEDVNESLIKKQTDLVQDNAREAQQMLTSLAETRTDLQRREDALANLSDSLSGERKRLQKLKADVDAKQKEIAKRDKTIETKNAELFELSEVIRKKDSTTNALKNKIAAALRGFDGSGLTIVQRNGKVYISLDESLMFEVGQSKVADKGVEALTKLAVVLAANKEMNVLVEGHTDNTGPAVQNWKLSTERALAITNILLANPQLEPSRLTAAGRGQFAPIDPSGTLESRQRNRRSEIILTPNLDELFNIIDDKK